jgi:uncharacterized protein (TIGR04255 family)
MSHGASPLTDLPEYERPPVVEVAISLQFKPLETLRVPHFGMLWSLLRQNGFTKTEEHGQIEPAFEDFESLGQSHPGVKFQTFDDAPPAPRVWFLNDTETELFQFQRDRLITNWKQGATTEPYPRYRAIIGRFKLALETFQSFLNAEKLGPLVPTQCEITYVNHIPVRPADIGNPEQIVSTWARKYTDDYLSQPEDVRFFARYRMNNNDGTPAGRLNVSLQPATRSSDRSPLYVLTLTGRGAPPHQDLNSVFVLFDTQHEWIVRGFTSLTTPEMHLTWKRIK